MAESKAQATAGPQAVVTPRSSISFIDRTLSFLSSVRLGIVLMLVLIVFSILGTFIMQYNIDGFEKYYAALTPAQRQLYHTLGMFDLYHTWWFNTLLIVFSLNLVLVSIDIFPKAWRYIAEPVVRTTPPFVRSQQVHRQFRLAQDEGLIDRLTGVMRSFRYKVKVMDDGSYITLFAQKGVWNRFLVFFVHIAVLLILGAAFVGSRWGYEGVIPLAPGEKTSTLGVHGAPILGIPDRNVPMPFEMVCNNIRVDLRDPDGPLAQGNFDNWYTDVTFTKGDQKETATIYLNHPYDYEGYRFFQASFGPPGGASDVTVDVKQPDGGQQSIKLERNKPADVAGLGQVALVGFRPDVLNDQAQEYSRPSAELEVVRPGGEKVRTAAFQPEMIEVIKTQSGMAGMIDRLQVDGYGFALKEFTRVPAYHVLQVQYDPGVDYTYLGYALLCASLIAVFMFSHERVWAVIDRTTGEAVLHLGGNTNRSQVSFEQKFERLVEKVAALGLEEVPEKNGTSGAKPADALT